MIYTLVNSITRSHIKATKELNLKASNQLKGITTEYIMPGCVSGCINRLLDTTEQSYRTYQKRDANFGKKYLLTEITPHCAKKEERAIFRADTYEKANRDADDAFAKRKKVNAKVRARKKAWNNATKLYNDGPCPFFEPVEGK